MTLVSATEPDQHSKLRGLNHCWRIDMYARVSTYAGTAETFDRGFEKVKSALMPHIQEVPGYRGAMSLIDRSTGKSLSITLWDSEESLRASHQRANQLRSDAAAMAPAEVLSVEEYEVAVADLRAFTT
jgi:heme-degrading monooxygenase HmoA